MSPASINYKADWCIVVGAIKVPDSVTDEHALLLAAMKCHVMALEKCGQELRNPDAVALLEATLKGEKATGSTLAGLRIAGFVVQSAPRRSGIGDSPRLPSFERRQPMRQSGLAIRTLKLGCLVFRLT